MRDSINMLEGFVLVLFILSCIGFGIIQMQFNGAEKRVVALESYTPPEPILLNHTHRYHDGRVK